MVSDATGWASGRHRGEGLLSALLGWLVAPPSAGDGEAEARPPDGAVLEQGEELGDESLDEVIGGLDRPFGTYVSPSRPGTDGTGGE